MKSRFIRKQVKKISLIMTVVMSLAFLAAPASSQAFYSWRNPQTCGGNFTPCGQAFADGGGYADGSDNQYDYWTRYFGYFANPDDMVVTDVGVRVDAWKSDPNANVHLYLLVTAVDEFGTLHSGDIHDIALNASQTSHVFNVTNEIDWNPYMLEDFYVKVNLECQVYSGSGTCNVDWAPLSATFAYL